MLIVSLFLIMLGLQHPAFIDGFRCIAVKALNNLYRTPTIKKRFLQTLSQKNNDLLLKRSLLKRSYCRKTLNQRISMSAENLKNNEILVNAPSLIISTLSIEELSLNPTTVQSSDSLNVESIAAIPEVHGVGFIDAHAHLIHEKFVGEEDVIAEKCRQYGLDYVIVNGLEPKSNRDVLELCLKHPNLLAAAGIYPIDAACNLITPGK